MTDYVIGIDLGTTNSCVGIWKNGKPEIIPDSLGNRIIPSYVSFTNEQRLIGSAAKKQLTKNIKNTVYDAKRLIGRTFSDPCIQEDLKLYPFKIMKDPKQDRPLIEVEFKGEKKQFLPQEISAMILSYLKFQVEEFLDTKITNAVITVPAYFNEGQKTATRDAGRIAGLNVLKIINEPTAAAVAFGLDQKFNSFKNIFIFDLGGGTFDVSILKLDHSKFEVLSINGNTHLGGEDFDNELVKYCLEEFRKETGIDVSKNEKAKKTLKFYCEEVKKDLSTLYESTIDIASFAEGEDFCITINRSTFEYKCKYLFEKCREPMKQALNDANLTINDIDEVVMVGGSSRIPKIQEMVSGFFNGKKLCMKINGDEAVAIGATIQGAILKIEDNVENLKISDINPITIGTDVINDEMSVLIPKGTIIPCKVSKTYVTSRDNQTEVLFELYQGERKNYRENYYLGGFEINELREAPKGEVRFEVVAELDENSILKVSAKEIEGKHYKDIEIKGVNKLTKDEINWFSKQEFVYKEEDVLFSKKIKAKNELNDYIYNQKNEVTKLSETKKNIILSKLDEFLNWIKGNTTASVGIYQKKLDEIKEFIQNEK